MDTYQQYTGIIPAKGGDNYTLTLRRKGAPTNSPARELTFYGEGFAIEREAAEDLLQPLRPLRATLHLKSETNYEYEHIAKDTQPWTLRIDLSGTTLFAGVVEQGLYEEDFEAAPYEVTLVATCGLLKLQDLPLDWAELPRNNYGLISVDAFVRHALERCGAPTLPIEAHTGNLTPSGYYIDTSEWEGDETPKLGELLETMLHDLALILYQARGKWYLVTADYTATDTPTLLGGDTYPVYATPSLSARRGFEMVSVELPTDTRDNLFSYATTGDVPDCTLGAGDIRLDRVKLNPLPPRRKLSKTPNLQIIPLTDKQRADGAILHVRPSSDDTEALYLYQELRLPPEAKSITVTVPISFRAADGSPVTPLPETKNSSVQMVLEAALVGADTNLYQARIGMAITASTFLWDGSVDEYVWDDYDKSKQNAMMLEPKANAATFSSFAFYGFGWLTDDSGVGNEGWAQALYDNRPWAESKYNEHAGGKFGTFSYTILLPYEKAVRGVNRLRAEHNQAPLPEYTHLLLRLPLRRVAWDVDPDDKKNKKKLNERRLTDSSLLIGKISVTATYRTDIDADKRVFLDRNTPSLREGEGEQLTYATETAGITRPASAKGWFYTEDASAPLKALYGTTSLLEHFSEALMRAKARNYDTLSLTVRSGRLPLSPIRPYTLKGRPGKTYVAVGSIFHPGSGEDEVTLVEKIPTTKEQTSIVATKV